MKRWRNQDASTCAGSLQTRPRFESPPDYTSLSEDYWPEHRTQGSSLEAEPSNHLGSYQVIGESFLASSTNDYSDCDTTNSEADSSENSVNNTFDVEEVPYSSQVQETLGPMTFADAIKCITEKKYDTLTKALHVSVDYSARRIGKVLASVVLQRQVTHGNDRLSIVALGAGSRLISGKFLSKTGHRIHDCHAEVLARRGLLRFLYYQLEKINLGDWHTSIFKKKHEVYALQEGISFHLYISKPPCGDAAVFGLHEFHPNRICRGIARATPEDGEGAVRIPEQNHTFEELKYLPSARLHKMCCSAKIARWNVIGVQGALLSLYIEPVYFSSITIGSQFSDCHLRRAVYTRVSTIKGLHYPYQVRNPVLNKVTTPNSTEKIKSHKMSLNWSLDQTSSSRELINCNYGASFGGNNISQQSKRELFESFTSLWDNICPQTTKEKARAMWGVEPRQYCYDRVKALAIGYQEAKQKVAEHFESKGCGSRWLRMPHEVDQFSLADPVENIFQSFTNLDSDSNSSGSTDDKNSDQSAGDPWSPWSVFFKEIFY